MDVDRLKQDRTEYKWACSSVINLTFRVCLWLFCELVQCSLVSCRFLHRFLASPFPRKFFHAHALITQASFSIVTGWMLLFARWECEKWNRTMNCRLLFRTIQDFKDNYVNFDKMQRREIEFWARDEVFFVIVFVQRWKIIKERKTVH